MPSSDVSEYRFPGELQTAGKSVGLIAASGSSQSDLVIAALARAGVNAPVFVDCSFPENQALTIEADALPCDGFDLTSLSKVYVQGFQYEEPVVPGFDGPTDWSLWQTGYIVRQQEQSFLLSLVRRLEAAGVAVINGADAHLLGFVKHHQLATAAGAGVATPECILSNDADAVAAFRSGHNDVLWRTAGGRSAWRIFRDKQVLDLVVPEKPPVMVAEIVEGPFCRAYVIEGRLLAAFEQHPPSREHLERLEVFRFVDNFDENSCDLLAGACEAVGGRWAAVSFVATAGGPVVYDIDVDPMLSDLPAAMATYLADCLAATLAGDEPKAPPFSPGDTFERSSLYLRRMLSTPFDLEASKYPAGEPE